MNRLRYALLAALAAGLVAVVLVVLVVGHAGRAPTAPPLARSDPLSASASLSPRSLLFGQPIHVRVDAVVDRRQLVPSRVRLQASWAPFQALAPPIRTEEEIGPYTRLHWAIDLHCVVTRCLPKPGSFVRQSFQTASIAYAGRAAGGAPVTPVRLTWPELTTVSRIDPADMAPAVIVHRSGSIQPQRAYAPWRLNSAAIEDATFRITPGTLFWGASLAALLLVLAAAVILAPYLPGFRMFARAPRVSSGVERAVEAVERARGGAAEEERKALELLAGELRRTGSRGLAWTATELAWSRSEPPGERTSELTARVRRDLAEQTNGHRD